MVSRINVSMVRGNFSKHGRNEVNWSFSGGYVTQNSFDTDEVNVTLIKQHSFFFKAEVFRQQPHFVHRRPQHQTFS